MTRTISITAGLFLALSPLISARSGLHSQPDRAQLASAIGGNQGSGKEDMRCDLKTYVGCVNVNDSCFQCAATQLDGSLAASTYQRVTTSGSDIPGWYADSKDPQGCGSEFNGTCVTDPDPNSTGFFCQGTLGANTCLAKPKVKRQGYSPAPPD